MATMRVKLGQRFILVRGTLSSAIPSSETIENTKKLQRTRDTLVSFKLSTNPLHSKKAVHENNKLLFPFTSAAHYGFSINTLF